MKMFTQSLSPFALLISTVLFSGALWADTNPKQKTEAAPADRFELLAKRLKLDDKQKAQLKPLLESLQAEREKSMKQLVENEQKELAKILKADQIQPVQRYLKYSRKAGSGRGPDSRGAQHREPKRPRDARYSQGVYPKPPKKLPKND